MLCEETITPLHYLIKAECHDSDEHVSYEVRSMTYGLDP